MHDWNVLHWASRPMQLCWLFHCDTSVIMRGCQRLLCRRFKSVGQPISYTGYQYAGASSSNHAPLCTPSSTGRVQRICQTLLSPSVQAVHVPDYVPLRRRTSHCHGCAQSSANVHLATPVLLRGTTCLKICAPLQTQRSSDSSWRLTFLLELVMFSDFRTSVFNVISDSCNTPLFRL